MVNSHLLYDRLAIWKDIQKCSVTPGSQSRDFMPINLGKQNKTKQPPQKTNKQKHTTNPNQPKQNKTKTSKK